NKIHRAFIHCRVEEKSMCPSTYDLTIKIPDWRAFASAGKSTGALSECDRAENARPRRPTGLYLDSVGVVQIAGIVKLLELPLRCWFGANPQWRRIDGLATASACAATSVLQ